MRPSGPKTPKAPWTLKGWIGSVGAEIRILNCADPEGPGRAGDRHSFDDLSHPVHHDAESHVTSMLMMHETW